MLRSMTKTRLESYDFGVSTAHSRPSSLSVSKFVNDRAEANVKNVQLQKSKFVVFQSPPNKKFDKGSKLQLWLRIERSQSSYCVHPY